uniref:Uncharacterized protein n=1 Tax=Glossina palpalis gambiensis TaxID=67801 RepID=A0A1B0BPB9_9MUSC
MAAIGPSPSTSTSPIHSRICKLDYESMESITVLLRMCLHGNDRRGRVYRRRGERFAPCCISERVAYGNGTFMFSRGISMKANTEFVFIIEPGIDRPFQRYIKKIPEEHGAPFSRFIGENCIFMHEKAY